MKILIISITFIFTIINCISPPPSSHFGEKCRLCHCYIKYDDRDFAVNINPYKKVENSYDATEDDCLKLCWDDEVINILFFYFYKYIFNILEL